MTQRPIAIRMMLPNALERYKGIHLRITRPKVMEKKVPAAEITEIRTLLNIPILIFLIP
jgi:hypothetical protein